MPRITLQDLENRILARLDGNTVWYDSVSIRNAVNEAQRIINLHLGYQQASVTITSISNRLWYDLPDPILIPSRVQFENEYLQPTSINNLGRSNPTWTSATTSNRGPGVSAWIPYGLTKFGIWPADAIGGGEITVTGVASIVPMTALTDTVNWGNDLLSAFDNYAVHILQLRESEETFSQASVDYMAYQQLVKGKTYLRGWSMPYYWIQTQQHQDK